MLIIKQHTAYSTVLQATAGAGHQTALSTDDKCGLHHTLYPAHRKGKDASLSVLWL